MSESKTTNYLVVGASSVAGQAAMRAIRKHAPEASIIATTSQNGRTIPDANRTIDGIDFMNNLAAETLLERLDDARIGTVFFTPSFGPVGYPAEETGSDDVNFALNFSVVPLVGLGRGLPQARIVSFSSFYWLPHISVAYGGMSAAKRVLEALAIEYPAQFGIIRSGVFFSKSLRGIMLSVRRTLRNTVSPRLLALQKDWKSQGISFDEYFLNFAHATERETFRPRFPDHAHRETDSTDLEAACLRFLGGEPGPVLNVIGSWVWEEDALPELTAEDSRAIGALVAGALDSFSQELRQKI
jgi:hypothetical protein